MGTRASIEKYGLTILITVFFTLCIPCFICAEETSSSDESEEAQLQEKSEKTDEAESVDEDKTTMNMMSDMGGSTGSGSGVFLAPEAVNVVYTGSATYRIPIAVPPGRKGIEPDLALQYNSYYGNGWVGEGWDLEIGAIQRSTKRGVDYSAHDYVVDGSELVSRSDWGTNYYGAKIEGEFTKYLFNSSTSGWEATTKDGTKYYYGTTASSRETNANGIFKWCLDRVVDTNGNYMEVIYAFDNGQSYPLEIEYTGNGALLPTKSVRFGYVTREDCQVSFESMASVTIAYLLQTITISSNSQLARKYMFTYENNPINGRSRLSQVQIKGSDDQSTLPAITFDWYNGGDGTFDTSNTTYMNDISGGFAFGDIDGNGTEDLIKYYGLQRDGESNARVYVIPFLSDGDGTFTGLSLMELAPADPIYVNVRLGDVNGDLMADIVSNGTGGIVNTYFSEGYGNFTDVYTSEGQTTYTIFLAELDGDGQMDLVRHYYSESGGIVYTCLSSGNGPFQTCFTHTGPGGNGAGLIRLADINGDGYSDLIKLDGSGTVYSYLAVGDGTFSSSSHSKSGLGTISEYINFAEINGDGLADIVRNDSIGRVYAYFSKGDGSFGEAVTVITYGASDNMSFGDVNGDGLTDIVQSYAGNNYTFISDGWEAYPYIVAGGAGGEGDVYLADVSGDGMADLIKIKTGGNCACVSLANRDSEDDVDPADHLKTINNELGGITTITYGLSSQYPDNYIPFIIYPVSNIRTNNGYGVVADTGYTYSGGYYDYPLREFWGFDYVKKTNHDGTTEETWYYQVDEYTKGKPQKTEMREPNTTLLKETIFDWDIYFDDPQYPSYGFVKLTQKVTNLYETGGISATTTETYTYNDSNGNLLTTVSSGTDAENVTKTNIYVNKGGWVWRLERETITGSTSGQVRRTDYTYQNDTGNLLTTTYWLNGETSPVVTMVYDSYGNVTSVTDPRSKVTTTTYDSTTYTYPSTITYPMTGSVAHVVEMEWDTRFGKITLFRDQNDQNTGYYYDPFGRVQHTDYPDGGQIAYTYYDTASPVYILKQVKETDSSYVNSYTYYDGYGRPIQTISFGEEGTNKSIVTRAYYDEMGRKDRTEGPYFSTSGIGYPKDPPEEYPYTEIAFDYLGRPETVTSPLSDVVFSQVEYSYEGFSTTVTDPEGHDKIYVKDYLGRIIEVQEDTGGGTTHYAYNAAGDLTGVQDANGNVTTINYDTLGRKRNMTDPDMGYWQYNYDANGNLSTQIDAKSQTITFIYDDLNRVTYKDYSTSDPDVTYAYDSGTNGIGLLYSVTNSNVTTTVNLYDNMGRVRQVTKTITGDSARVTSYTYDLSGKVLTITYPGGYVVTNTYYTGSNLLHEVKNGSTVFAALSDYEPTGKIGTMVQGNGVTTTYSYNSYTTRLDSIETVYGITTLQHRSYTYSDAGDITQIVDNLVGVTYDYGYDDLHRLETETNNGGYGAMTVMYNAIGNITSKTVGSNTLNIYYDSTHKHAVDYINSTSYDFTYDANGNMTQGYDFVNPSTPVKRTITWNADNMPSTITKGSSTTTLLYDGTGARAKKTVGSTITYYIGDHWEEIGGTATKYIYAGNLRVAQIKGSTVTYFHKDHLGSSTVMTNSSGAQIEATNYEPFGGMRAHSGTTTSNYKYTDQELDAENGLYNYDARLYDPVIGRFISADPIVPDPYNPQSLNRYSYCLNNPLIYVDPSGHQTDDVVEYTLEEIIVYGQNPNWDRWYDPFFEDWFTQRGLIDLFGSLTGFELHGFLFGWTSSNSTGNNGSSDTAQSGNPVYYPVKDPVVKSPFGARIIFGKNEDHKGTDYRNPESGAVFSATNGKVESIGTTSSGANYILVCGNDGNLYGYYHTESFVEKNMAVNAAEQIGITDRSGRSTGPHLHFTIQTDMSQESRIDPDKYLREHNAIIP